MEVRAALQRRPAFKKVRLLHAPVEYYSPEAPPYASWAMPEKVVMRKTAEYARQVEYRLAFGHAGAFLLNNVRTQITATPGTVLASLEGHPQHLLKIGSLKKVCIVHYV